MVRSFRGDAAVRIAFADLSGWDIHAGSVASMPMGGSQAAACYLAQALAKQGHEVFFLCNTTAPGIYEGVSCLSWRSTHVTQLAALACDAVVCLLGATFGPEFRAAVGAKPKLILWTQHSYDQESVQSLGDPRVRESYDAIALVSEWQRAEFVPRFSLTPERVGVLRNAPAPSFLELFGDEEAILSAKASPPILAYTSTPYRGLDLLLDVFPAIRAAVPDVRLRVFSSMQVYQIAPVLDHLQHGVRYQRCRTMPGVEYVGSLPQPALAAEMRAVTMLAYPNTFAETSCITAMEAMAAGCHVVTSALGALPETTAGFARLVPVELGKLDWAMYREKFVAAAVEVLREHRRAGPSVEERLRQQVMFMHEHGTWDRRAREWVRWLEAVPGCG